MGDNELICHMYDLIESLQARCGASPGQAYEKIMECLEIAYEEFFEPEDDEDDS